MKSEVGWVNHEKHEMTRKEFVPRLRFPEFRKRKPWKERQVGDVFKVTRGQVLAMSLVQASKTDEAPYPVYSSRTKENGLSGYYNEYLFEYAITWTTDGANAGDVNFRQGKFYCTNVCGVLISEEGYANDCIAALLNNVTRNHVSYVGNPKLMNGVMAKIVIPFPERDEQQKIADCLGSLDDLIAAEGRKLAALRDHKKGLMQQLFPREGETRPRPCPRFPEFRDAGDWETVPLEELGEFVSDRISVDQLSQSNYVSTENILPEFGGVTTAAKLPSTNGAIKFIADDILVSNIRPYLKKVWQADRSGGASNDVIVIRPTDATLKLYLPVVLKSDAFITCMMNGAKGVKMPRGDIATIKKYAVYLPSPAEQQRLADCLSALDALIAAQAEKRDALRTHKRGLMQQLFPSPEAT